MRARQQFLEGLAAEAGFDPALLDRSGTTLAAREERDGTGIVIVYEAGEQSLIWGDQQVLASLSDFADDTRCVEMDRLSARLAALGSPWTSSYDMRVLGSAPPPTEPPPIDYVHRWLRAADAADLSLVQAFADRSPPADVEEADLDDLEDFADQAINVLIPEGTSDLVAYASAAAWDWDPQFGDIGVLVDTEHRRRGLGTLVVGHTVQALRADGRLPLYRHDQANTGSAGIADAIGFERVSTLSAFMPVD